MLENRTLLIFLAALGLISPRWTTAYEAVENLQNPEPPSVVSISATVPETSEPSHTATWPAEFRLSRTGSTANELSVQLGYEGTAINGIDYLQLPDVIRFAPGASETNIIVQAVPDSLSEFVESLVARILPDTCISPQGLIGWWTGEQNFSDTSGFNNHGFSTNVIHSSLGKVGEAFVFNGVNSWITIPESFSLTVTNLTLCAWVNPQLLDNQPIIEFADPNDWVGVHLWVGGGNGGPLRGSLLANFRDRSGINHSLLVPGAIRSNEWSFVAATYDAETGLANLYHNGNLISSTNFGTILLKTDTLVSIGRRLPNTFDSAGGSIFNGMIDEVEVYNRALSEAELDRIYALGASKCYNIDGEPSSSAPYIVNANSASAVVSILDAGYREPGSVTITRPITGKEYLPGETIAIEAQAYPSATNVAVRWLEIYSGTNLIRTFERGSWQQVGAPLIVSHYWTNSSVGLHTLTARARDWAGSNFVSEPVSILVDFAARPNVDVAFYSYRSLTIPYADFAPGYFQFQRSGNIDDPLMVFIDVTGTATPGGDYTTFSNFVVFPAGEGWTGFIIDAIDDSIDEATESISITLRPAPPGIDSPYPMDYTIGLDRATGFVYDNEGSDAAPHLEVIRPYYQQLFETGSNIEFEVLARDPQSYIPRVELALGNTLLSRSELEFPTAPRPGTPLTHTLIFSNAPPRAYHGLQLKGYDAKGAVVASNVVWIAVGPNADKVTLALTSWDRSALERSTNTLTDSASFNVSRWFGPTNQDVRVFLAISGTASNGLDYAAIPASFILPAGVGSTNISIAPFVDSVIEGTESILVTLLDPGCSWTNALTNPATNKCYLVSTNNFVEISIEDGIPTPGIASIRIDSPLPGTVVRQFEPAVGISAIAIDPDGFIPKIEFYAGAELIGVSERVFPTPPLPGTPVHHSLMWEYPPAGEHVLTARGISSLGTIISSPVRFRVGADPSKITVELQLLDYYGSEVRKNGEVDSAGFRIRRVSGPTNQPVAMSFSLAGPAQNGIDYQFVHTNVSIPAFHGFIDIIVNPILDNLLEGDEMVFLTLDRSLCDIAETNSSPISPTNCYSIYGTNVSWAIIRDGPANTNRPPDVAISAPSNGQNFSVGEQIYIAANASDPDGTIQWLDLFINDQLAWRTNSARLAYRWDNAPAGTHTLVARATDNGGALGSSAPIQITIGSTTNIARIQITEPLDGQTLYSGSSIRISATAIDPNGYMPRLEFYAGTNRIGVSQLDFVVAPPPGTPLSHSITWSDALLGTNVLTAIGMDSRRSVVRSSAVWINVIQRPEQVVLAIEMIDAVAGERSLNSETNNAIFRVSRVGGPTNEWVSFILNFDGTAQNGVDYQTLGTYIHLAPNQPFTNFIIRPLFDELSEGDESVMVALYRPDCGQTNGPSVLPFVPIPSCYAVRGTNIVQAVIRDRNPPTNQLPITTMVSPIDGAVFEFGQPIQLIATAHDLDGAIHVTDLIVDGQIFWRTNSPSAVMRWDNAPIGEHLLLGQAFDNLGGMGQSAPVRILVRAANTNFVQRELPASYLPRVPFDVRLIANPPAGAQAWGAEDRVPQGWQVTEISHGGIFDPENSKVKFGHFTDSTNRILTFKVTAPPGSTSVGEFAGLFSIDGRNYPIFGSSRITPLASEHHPADRIQDKRMTLSEVTGYAAAWKRGTNWPAPPNPIPASYVTRAALLWRQGEAYHFVGTNPPPFCWMPNSSALRIAAASASAATRTISDGSNAQQVSIEIAPGEDVASYTVEERLPQGWTASDISHDGKVDLATGIIRWGLFMDGERRTLTYELIPTPNAASAGQLFGEMTFDGTSLTVQGQASVSTGGAQAGIGLTAARTQDGGVTLTLTGAAGQICVLEQSTDLANWTHAAEVFLPDGTLNLVSLEHSAAQRFYRLRTR